MTMTCALQLATQPPASSPIVRAERRLVVLPEGCRTIPALSLFISAGMICATGSGYAAQANPIRMDTSSSVVQIVARQQDIEFCASEALTEIKRRSSLTWDQLAKIFDVSRRAVHSWANGDGISAANSSKVQHLLDQVRSMAGTPLFKLRERLLLNAGIKTSEPSLRASDEPPILMSDSTPPVHQLAIADTKLRVVRD